MLLLAAALSLAVASSACAPSAQETSAPRERRSIVIAATTQPASAPIFVALKKGYFGRAGLDARVVMYTASNYTLASVIDGAADFAIAAETPLAQAALDGSRYSIVATIARVNEAGTIVARRDRGIFAPQDLVGKKVGVVAGTTGEYYLHIYLSAFRIPADQVEVVKVLPYEIVPAIVRGDVDAISTWFPFTFQAETSLKDNVIVLDEPGLYTTSSCVVTSPRTAVSEQQVSEQLIRALVEATEYMREHPADAQSIVAEAIGVQRDALAMDWDDYRWAVRLDQSLLLGLDDAARWISQRQRGVPAFTTFVESGALRAVAPDSVTIIEVHE